MWILTHKMKWFIVGRTFLISLLLYCILMISCSEAINKYSAEANLRSEDPVNFRTVEKPFRMAKLNLLWTKAQVRLTEPKLKSLYSELKVQDKEELAWKRLKADGVDKEGLKEAELRKKLREIMDTYGLLEHFEDVATPAPKLKQSKAFNEATDDYINKSMFKDKKLNKLWEKAEKAGFTAEELKTLREEFSHHQEKIDQYYSLLQDVEEGKEDDAENSLDNKLDKFNKIEELEEPDKDLRGKANALRERHRDIRDGYDHLQRLAAKGPNSTDFVEPKVQGLWRMAVDGDFTPSELASLKVELQHYEQRLLKLRHLQAEAMLSDEHRARRLGGEKILDIETLDEKIKKTSRKVQKIHTDLENRIMEKHVEL